MGDVYNSVGALVDPKVPEYLMSTVKEADAKAAYAALVDFAGVVKAHPITASTPASTVSGGSISSAASKLSAAAYPLIKDVYNAMAGVVGSSPVPNYLYSQVNPQDAQAAYNALLEFKDVVKAAQR